MSADSLRKQSKQGNYGQVILPQPVSDPSLIESVAGFIHEVVPQAYSSVLPGDSKDGILWARFESTDYNNPENYPLFSECESESTPPLLLVLGYSSGVQVWGVGGSGEATELLSWCQGTVRCLRLLPGPLSSGRDPHHTKRPLVAIVDSSAPGPQFATLSFISLRNAEVVKIIKFSSAICDVACNSRSVVVTFSEKIAVFDAASLEDRLTITTCYPSPGNSPNPIALGTRWLAYGEKRLTSWQRSSGGCEGDGAQSYTSTVIHAAKSLGKGLRELGGSLTGGGGGSGGGGGGGREGGSTSQSQQPGVVSIIDIEKKSSSSEEEKGNMIAHFVAHTSAVVWLTFDPSGLLLLSADRHGHRFNVFRIQPHPSTAALSAVHHLYVLHRGETTARVQDMTVSWDSRWVAVSSVRGTTHVFPITPYGGPVTVRTHTTPHVVNKLSRFERSAGLRDGRGSPLPTEAGGGPPLTPPPPRLPPYPQPTLVSPTAQLRSRPEDYPLAASFGPPRAWLPSSLAKTKRSSSSDSLYLIYHSGALIQYDLEPRVIQGVAKEKISFDTPIELGVEAKAEWLLPKPPYTSSLCPPLPGSHPLLASPQAPHQPPDKWLSQVEIVTHTGPHRRLWMGPQFVFKAIDPLPMSGEGGEIGPESANPLKSNPVNMPHRPFLLVEVGSAGSPQLSELTEAGGRLREDLADAMQETQHAVGEGVRRLRRAEVEWQVNPLGAVQTHPPGAGTWPRNHPIYLEAAAELRYPPSSSGVSQEGSQLQSLEAALQQRLSLQEELLEAVKSSSSSKDVSTLTEEAGTSTTLHQSTSTESITAASLEIPSKIPETKPQLLFTDQATDPMSLSVFDPLPTKGGDTSNSGLSSDEKNLNTTVKQKNTKEETEDKNNKPAAGKKNRKKKKTGKSTTRDETSMIESKVQHDPVEVETVESSDKTTEKDEHDTASGGTEPFDVLRSNQTIDDLLSEDILVRIDVPDVSIGEDEDILLPILSRSPPNAPEVSSEDASTGVKVSFSEETPELIVDIDVDCSSGNVVVDCREDVVVVSSSLEQDVISVNPLLHYSEEVDDSPGLAMGKALLEGELDLPPLTFDISPVSNLQKEISHEIPEEVPKDLNGNDTQAVEPAVDISVLPAEHVSSENPDIAETVSVDPLNITPDESDSQAVEKEPEEFVTVSSKSVRNKNRRKRKEKKVESPIQSEIESSSEPIVTVEEVVPPDVPTETSEMPADVSEQTSIGLSTEKSQESDEQKTLIQTKSSIEDSLKSSLEGVTSSALILSEDVQSDQVQSTDKSEVEDVSSHSGKESDEPKIGKKERSRKQRRSESSMDRAELKKKSPSPATAKSDSKDSESSDEAGLTGEAKQVVIKIPKRKKGKNIPECVIREDPNSSSSVSGSKDKGSESSLESGSDWKPPRSVPLAPSRTVTGASAGELAQSVLPAPEDRDSVYESCNDDGASDSLAFESSKEDFDETGSKTTHTATEPPTSSTTEERNTTDSCDRTTVQPLKKVRKQKKKKR